MFLVFTKNSEVIYLGDDGPKALEHFMDQKNIEKSLCMLSFPPEKLEETLKENNLVNPAGSTKSKRFFDEMLDHWELSDEERQVFKNLEDSVKAGVEKAKQLGANSLDEVGKAFVCVGQYIQSLKP